MKAFKTESKKLLDLMINSIYTNHDVFLRELISNASDALDKARMQGVVQAGDACIRVSFDQDARTLTVSDNGIGMNAAELESCLGTIAHSDSQSVKAALASEGENAGEVNIIGQFGVGFYSAFMVADLVQVVSRSAHDTQANRWESDGVDGYQITPAERTGSGTDVVLHIRPSTPEHNFERFLDQSTLVGLIQHYSNYIRYPIVMNLAEEHFDEQTGALVRNVENSHEQVVNSMTPIWVQDEASVSQKDLDAFYCSEFHDPTAPLLCVRARARGAIDYDAILYVPANAAADLYAKDAKYGPKLYSAGVLIEDECPELVPSYLRFLCGVVDVQGAQLNVSREAIQQDARIEIIKRQLERQTLDALRELQMEDRARYEKFFEEYGTGLKFSLTASQGALNEVINGLLLYPSAKQGQLISLQEYLPQAKPAKHQEIYYATGPSTERLLGTPVVQSLLAQGSDVLLCPAGAQDELCFMMMGHFKGARFVSTSSAQIATEQEGSKAHELSDEVKHTLYALYKCSPYPLARVTPSPYLTQANQAASRLATDHGLSISMAKYLNTKVADGQAPQPVFVLEVNTTSCLYARAAAAQRAGDTRGLQACAWVLLGQAFLAEDISLPSPIEFNQAIDYLLQP